MATGLLITAVLFFAVRGMFLGLNGVIGRLLGLALGYVVAYRFRHPLAAWVSQHTEINLPDIAVQMMAGLLLFVCTLFITGVIVKALLKLLGKIIPGVNAIVDNNTLGGKVAGATVNGLIAAAVVCMGIWGYGKVTGKNNPDDQLQQFANRFGDRVFTVVSDNTDLDLQTFTSTTTTTRISSPNNRANSNTVATTKGSAYIVSSTDPAKSLSIEQIREVIEQNPELATAVGNNFTAEQLQPFINNPQLREMAMRQLQQPDNSEQLQNLLKNPKLRELLEQLQTAAP